jgi:hypothetical protein
MRNCPVSGGHGLIFPNKIAITQYRQSEVRTRVQTIDGVFGRRVNKGVPSIYGRAHKPKVAGSNFPLQNKGLRGDRGERARPARRRRHTPSSTPVLVPCKSPEENSTDQDPTRANFTPADSPRNPYWASLLRTPSTSVQQRKLMGIKLTPRRTRVRPLPRPPRKSGKSGRSPRRK